MKTFKADEYTTGGWTQNLGAFPKRGMTTVMYGMIEDLEGLTTARGCDSWSPVETHAPLISASSLWSYGGDGSLPSEKYFAVTISNSVNGKSKLSWLT